MNANNFFVYFHIYMFLLVQTIFLDCGLSAAYLIILFNVIIIAKCVIFAALSVVIDDK
jgi:hypothetical protein